MKLSEESRKKQVAKKMGFKSWEHLEAHDKELRAKKFGSQEHGRFLGGLSSKLNEYDKRKGSTLAAKGHGGKLNPIVSGRHVSYEEFMKSSKKR